MRSLQWDIFCKVIDNFGDIGVCWRLAADLADRGQQVRLWVDDGAALAWMALDACASVQVLPWTQSMDVSVLEIAPCDVLIEAFGCDAAPEFIAACARIYSATGIKPLWINLEYLSAESYVARCHGLKNLLSGGPAAGWHKVFYYPGFFPGTGGLLREPDLARQQAAFDREAWLERQGIDWQGETLVSLFCYEPPALTQLLANLEQNGINGQRAHLLVAAGRATEAVKSLLALKKPKNAHQIGLQPNEHGRVQLSISYLPQLSQTDFDHLMWASDINFVRGEDSMVRAIWAGKPFVWQIYPQNDGAHGPKLAAFLDMLEAKPGLRAFHHAWNGLAGEVLPPLPELTGWQETISAACTRLALQPDLTTGLIEYALKTR